MDRPTLPQARWAYQHRCVIANPTYDSLLRDNAAMSQRLAEMERQDWLATSAPIAQVAAAPAEQPLVMPWPVEATTDSALPMQLERTSAEQQAAAFSQPIANAPSSDLAAYGFHRSSGIGDAFPMLFGVMFVMVIGGIVVAAISAMRRAAEAGSVASGGYESVPIAPASELRQMDTAILDDPLGLAVGQDMAIRLPEYAGARFAVEEIEQYSTRVNGQQFTYSAYWVGGEVAGELERLQLRVERLAHGGLAVLVLHVHDELDYSQELYNIVEKDRTGMFQITDDDTGAVTAEYHRPAGVLSAYKAAVTRRGAGGRTSTRQVQYWDYSRQADVPRGTIDEYLIVEMESSGRFRILVGPQVDAEAIESR